MKKFALACDAGHGFAGWFRSGEDLTRALEGNDFACPDCGSTNVIKALQRPNMPPSLGRGRGKPSISAPPAAPAPTPIPTPTSAPVQTPTATAVTAPQAPVVVPSPEALEQFAKLYTAVKKVQEHVEKNFDNVGTGFAEEARKIHYGESPERGIVGQATKQDVEELNDEGIEVLPLPQLPKSDA